MAKKLPLLCSIGGFGFSSEIGRTAGFFVRQMCHPSADREVIVVFLRRYERSEFNKDPDDLIAGWAWLDDKDHVLPLVLFMKEHLEELKELRASRGS